MSQEEILELLLGAVAPTVVVVLAAKVWIIEKARVAIDEMFEARESCETRRIEFGFRRGSGLSVRSDVLRPHGTAHRMVSFVYARI